MGRTAGLRLFISFKAAFTAASLCALLMPTLASAHVERASYWPDPAPDCSISPCAGGQVPTPRSLASALDSERDTRVVCQPRLPEARHSSRSTSAESQRLRTCVPRGARQKISAAEGRALLDLNRKLSKRCALRLDPGRRERSPATTTAS